MDKIVDLIAGNFIVLAAFMVPVAIVAISGYFSHKRTELIHQERLAAIARGIIPTEPLPDPEHPKDETEKRPLTAPDYLRRGLFWLCPGAGLVIFSTIFLADVAAGIRLPILGVSIAVAGVGVAYMVIFFVENEKEREALRR